MQLDIQYFLQWWLTLFILGALAYPLTHYFFKGFWDKGYAFSKIIGIIIISYLSFAFGSIHLLSFSFSSLFCIGTILFLFSIYFLRKKYKRSIIAIAVNHLKANWGTFIFQEALFLLVFVFWTYVRSFTPEINGLEKFMDFGFMNSINRSVYFPPKDMWLTPFSINYYYFGHLITVVLARLSGLPTAYGYNLMIATIAGLCFSQVFSLAATLFKATAKKIQLGKYLLVGGLSALLVTFSGNLHAIYSFFLPYQNEQPVPFWNLAFSFNSFPNSYWYPNATRFIHNTIHEFPIYSWVVSDLHGHVLDIPIVILTIGFLLTIFVGKKYTSPFKANGNKTTRILDYVAKKITMSPIQLVFLGFLLSVMYMTNAWDGLIYLMFAAILLFALQKDLLKSRKIFFKNIGTLFERLIIPVGILGVIFFLFSLPFSIHFKPFVSGIGVLCAPKFLTDMGHAGPLLFEADHCQKSPLWQLGILYGFFFFYIICFLAFIIKAKKKVSSDIFVLLLIIVSVILIIVPEFIYVKDIYPAHYRANTMFKLVFQSFIMLSLSSGYIIGRISQVLKSKKSLKGFILYTLFFVCSIPLLTIVFIYPYFAITSFYGNVFSLKDSQAKVKTIDGMKYLQTKYPDDYKAINWINKNIQGQPVIVEAQGDSYTDYGRISSNTGLPTILGWTVHEWLWRGTYDVPAPRIDDVKNIYQAENKQDLENYLDNYNVEYIYLGGLEREKYSVNEELFDSIGKVVFQSNQTKIYKY